MLARALAARIRGLRTRVIFANSNTRKAKPVLSSVIQACRLSLLCRSLLKLGAPPLHTLDLCNQQMIADVHLALALGHLAPTLAHLNVRATNFGDHSAVSPVECEPTRRKPCCKASAGLLRSCARLRQMCD